MNEVEVNVIRTDSPYKFKHLICNSEVVFTGYGNVNLYVNQSCTTCNYNSIGYYLYIRKPQNFKCRKCKFEWSICCLDGVNSKMDSIEKALFDFDESVINLEAAVKDCK